MRLLGSGQIDPNTTDPVATLPIYLKIFCVKVGTLASGIDIQLLPLPACSLIRLLKLHDVQVFPRRNVPLSLHRHAHPGTPTPVFQPPGIPPSFATQRAFAPGVVRVFPAVRVPSKSIVLKFLLDCRPQVNLP